MTVAVTGATGFVGSRLLKLMLEGGVAARALTRSPRTSPAGVEWVEGTLDQRRPLERLVDGASAVIHVAGAISAPSEAAFDRVNVAGTALLAEAAVAAGARRFVHVSSLAARHPELSLYGGSKARSEALLAASPLAWTIVRPPAVYGPGDRETLELFRLARLGLVLMPPAGRLSLVHADDLARLLLLLALGEREAGAILEPDDGRAGGWAHREFAQALAAAVGRRALSLAMPRSALRAGAWLDGLLRGSSAKLTRDRVAYFCHPDWAVDPARGVPTELWQARIDTRQGLADTYRWYRAEGWL